MYAELKSVGGGTISKLREEISLTANVFTDSDDSRSNINVLYGIAASTHRSKDKYFSKLSVVNARFQPFHTHSCLTSKNS